jgi:putative DNA methylase
MTTPVMAVKTLSVKHWEHECSACGAEFHVEEAEARIAPNVPLYVAPDEFPYSVLDTKGRVTCPLCRQNEMVSLGKGKKKKVALTLLVHPEWLKGSPNAAHGKLFGGAAQDSEDSTAYWNTERARHIRLLEVRGNLPDNVTCPETMVTFATGKAGGTVPKKSSYTCSACGTVQDVLGTIKATLKTGPMAGYAVQGFSPKRKRQDVPYNGRFFSSFGPKFADQYSAAVKEWESRKNTDLAGYWPTSEVPYGFMTHMNNGGIPNHGFTHWWTMFNPRQLLVLSQLLKAILEVGDYDWRTREYVLGAFQQYLRNQNMFCFWDIGYDKLVPHMSNNNYHPKSNVIENSVFSSLGRGNWTSCSEIIVEGEEWTKTPWEPASVETLAISHLKLSEDVSGRSEKVFTGDPVRDAEILQCSSTELAHYQDASIDLVITDPPFGGLLHYSELADFFHVWLRLPLKDKYPNIFGPEYSPKSMEAVANRAREPEDADGFYQRLLTACWKEAHRILKPGGMLAFTFHHSEDAPWVSVLESLFDAGFYLEATYPIRSDETKGEGSKPGTFGSQQIEYDIIHVCRKRTEEPKVVSWARMRREVLADVHQLQSMLENHARAGLPPADLQVIRRGKALEYFSRHYGRVYVDEGRAISVKDALVGINQLIDEDTNKANDPPPVTAEPITRQFLRIFQGKTELARDQMQKSLRGSGIAPDEFTNRAWANEQKKIFHLADPLEFAHDWHGRHKRRLTVDLDQALVLVGACYDGSGINASDTLKNESFKPHAALKGLLDWLSKRGSNQSIRNAASRALSIYNGWAENNHEAVKQLSLFQEE